MTFYLFLLPTILNPSRPFVVSQHQYNGTFISLFPDVESFVSEMAWEPKIPHVSIIGRIMGSCTYVVFFQKKIYRCLELWNALDLALKLYISLKLEFRAETASAWEFLMLHFYDWQGRIIFSNNVLSLQKMLDTE